MNKMQKKSCQIINNLPINMVTIIWILIITRCIFRSNGMVLEYLIWGLALYFFLVMVTCSPWVTSTEKKLLIGFGILCFVQVFGLLALGTSFAIKNVVATPLIGSLVIIVSIYGELPEKYISRIFYYTYIIIVLFGFQKGNVLDNTFSGCFVFLNLLYLSIELNYFSVQKNRGKFGLLIKFVISTIITTLIIFKSGARTALICFFISIISFVILSIIKINTKVIDKLFYVIIIGLIVMILVYIHISDISWFQAVNQLSKKYFDKNINSSRDVLWRSAFQEMNFLQIIFGKGTGSLPQLKRYQNSSFHSTYIQLIVQNGILGLWLLLYIFRTLWCRLSKYANDIVVQFTLCCFLGILLYNCFECTMLQNKAFLGAIQWILICFGIIRVRLLENRKNKMDKYYYEQIKRRESSKSGSLVYNK